MLIGPIIIQNIRPEFCVRGCDIALACEGYITSEDTKRGSYILYIGPISILYTIYCMMVTTCFQSQTLITCVRACAVAPRVFVFFAHIQRNGRKLCVGSI